MRHLIFAVVAAVMFSQPAGAEKVYVTDSMEITLRTGPGIDHKIIGMLKTGRQVNRTEKGDEWSKVALEDGREGWVLNRFVSAAPPSALVLEDLRAKHQVLTQQAAELLEENVTLKAQNESLSAELDESRAEASQLSEAYETLRTDCDAYFALKADHEQCTSRLAEQTRKARQLDQALQQANEKRIYYWFLCGAGVLVLGFLIGFSVRKERRRSSLF